MRPAEWVIVALVIFVVGKAGLGALTSLTGFVADRSELVLAMLVLVAEAQLVWAVWQTPKAKGERQLRLRRFLPVALTPMLVATALLVTAEPPADLHSHSGRWVLVFASLVLALALTSLPFAVWLALRLDSARHEDFELRRLVRWSTRGVLEAARDWLPLVVMISGYSWMGAVMELTPVTGADATLAAMDRALFGVDPAVALQPFIRAPLSEYLAFSYSFYALLFPICFGALDGLAGRAAFRETAFAASLGMLLAYVSYTLVPAKGPVFTLQFSVPLDLYYLESIKEGLMDLSRITWDCFPSMHTALTVVMMAGLYRHVRWLFWVLIPITGTIPFACVYLRYHYVVDVLVGLVLAPVLVWVARRVFRSSSASAGADTIA